MKRILQCFVILFSVFALSDSAFALSTCEGVCSKNHYIKKIILQKRVLEKEFSQGDQYVTAIDDFIEKNAGDFGRLEEIQSRVERALPQLGVSAIKEALVYLYYKIDLALYNTEGDSIEVDNAIMDVSYQYIINSPSSNGEYTTTESELTIEGYTNNPDITEVHVNDYKVLSFDGNTWTYLASSNFGSLNVGNNVYKIDYYNEAGAIIHSKNYVIIKDTQSSTEQTHIYSLEEEAFLEYVQSASLEELENKVYEIYEDDTTVYQKVVEIYETQIEKARDTTRIADLKVLQAAVEQTYQDYGEYPTSENFIDRGEIYINSIPEDTFSGYVIDGCNFGYKYEVGESENGITNQKYRLSTCFENQDSIERRALNTYDDGVNDLAYEIGYWDDTTIFTDAFYVNGISEWEEKEEEPLIPGDIDSLSNESKRGVFSLLMYEKYAQENPEVLE